MSAQLLLVAHGTRDPAGAVVTEAVAEQVRGLVGVRVAVSYADGADPLTAATNGFQSAFATAIVFAAIGLTVAVTLLGKLRVAVPEPLPQS